MQSLGVNVHVIELPVEVRDMVIKPQERQYR
jgi:hypothetical protein